MSPASRKLAVGLALSVALNMFLLGVLVARMWPTQRHAFGGPGRALFHADEAFRGDEPRMKRILRAHKGELMAQRRAAREARRKVRAALEAEPFDRAQLDRELQGLRAETQRSQEALHRAFLDLATQATPEQRRRLGRSLVFSRRGSAEPAPAAP